MEVQAFCFSQLFVVVMVVVYTVCSAKSVVTIVTISYSCTRQTVQPVKYFIVQLMHSVLIAGLLKTH